MSVGRFAKGALLGWVVPLVVVLVAFQLFFYRQSSIPGVAAHPPAGLQDINSELDLQTRFAQDAGHTRLVLLISPT